MYDLQSDCDGPSVFVVILGEERESSSDLAVILLSIYLGS